MKVDPQAREKLLQYLDKKTVAQQADNRMLQIDKGFILAHELLSKINDSVTNNSPEKISPLLIELVRINTLLLDSMKSLKVELPHVYPVEGSVDVNSLPAIEVKNLPDIKQYLDGISKELTGMQLNVKNMKELKPYFDALNESLKDVQSELITVYGAIKNIPFPKDVVIPDSFNINKFDDLLNSFGELKLALVKLSTTKPTALPKSFSVDKFDELLDGVEELKKGFNLLINKEVGTVGFPDKEIPVVVTNFKYPAPVTHISLNSLKGPILATKVDVGTTATPLPATPLEYRRAVVVFNNGATTFYLGGADVTVASGLPVPAATFAPALDSGAGSIVYGICASGTVEARILETSDYEMGF